MSRKVHNTITALTIASIGLVLALMVAQPAMPPAPLSNASPLPVDGAQGLRGSTVFAPASATDATPPASKRRPTRRMRQTVAMPFFSFAPRG